jgi:2-polyprenyl-6-methoxyphenol hydroxylase-like FAD-dependent oxidoreductase
MKRVDAIVVGGGIAGSCTAAALAREGLEVLLCESGLPSDKRLAGELMHPPAAEDLDRLGLLEPLVQAGAAPVYGFAVLRGSADRGTMLSYSEVIGARASSIAIEHATMTRTLLSAVSERPRVTVREGARVLDVDASRAHPIITLRGGERIETALVVLADGRSSRLRAQLGFPVSRGEELRMVGWRVPSGRLPYPGFGHVFVSEKGTTLAYQISARDVRIMFEVGADESLGLQTQIAELPEPFRRDVEHAIRNEARLTTKVFALSPGRVTANRVALVGDAGGCVHPLTASGIAFCTRDATRLGRAVGHRFDAGEGVPTALALYEKERHAPMRARTMLGPALVETLTSTSPEMRLLRRGLFRYWAKSPRGRRTSMGLLSTQESRGSIVAREYASVCLHALMGLGELDADEMLPAVAGLVRRSAEQMRELVS